MGQLMIAILDSEAFPKKRRLGHAIGLLERLSNGIWGGCACLSYFSLAPNPSCQHSFPFVSVILSRGINDRYP